MLTRSVVHEIANDSFTDFQHRNIRVMSQAVRAIGRCAIKLDSAAERCINVLLDLIQTKVRERVCSLSRS